MTHVTPFIQGSKESPLACLTKNLTGLAVPEHGLLISRSNFLVHVHALAEQLPDQPFVLNLCDNRYLFLVAAWAAILRRQTNLLPSNRNAATQNQLSQRYKDIYTIHDGHADLDSDISAFDISELDWSLSEYAGDIPQVAREHQAIISFTSGSTGDSKPNIKTWRTLEESSRINAKYMLPNTQDMFFHLATVPAQHMWGLETSVLLPVFANACLVDARPMFPADILEVLLKLPKPISLISTPLHLRTLSGAQANSEVCAPELASVLCATAPLDAVLAQKIETQFSTRLGEVYGCSEVGSMALRRSAYSEEWTQFSGLDFTYDDHGNTSVSSAYLPDSVVLEDKLEMLDNCKFKLSGRTSDQIKIAGKRGSLHEANVVLGRFSGLLDGVIFFPEQNRLVPRLVAIVVLEDAADKLKLRDHLRQFLDAAFVPRPIYVVETLPREENGKLSKQKLLALYKELSGS